MAKKASPSLACLAVSVLRHVPVLLVLFAVDVVGLGPLVAEKSTTRTRTIVGEDAGAVAR
jgi:hypothetical protein